MNLGSDEISEPSLPFKIEQNGGSKINKTVLNGITYYCPSLTMSFEEIKAEIAKDALRNSVVEGATAPSHSPFASMDTDISTSSINLGIENIRLE